VADVASECHRIARLGLDRSVDAEEEELRVWATRAAAGCDNHHPGGGGAAEEGVVWGGSKGGVDVFGQTHPAIAADIIECMNCGRPVVAGRFAPHLEKCMGKVNQSLHRCRSLWIRLPDNLVHFVLSIRFN
jgi:SAGA-associated factor 11